MITLPDDVQKGDNWDGVSRDTGAPVNNLQSAMSFKEHQRIVCAAGGLLESLAYTEEEQQADKAKSALMLLKRTYTGNDGGVLYISKGIHQPYSNPHLQLSVEDDGKKTLYHLDVSAHTVVIDHGGSEHFHWTGVCFSARIKNGKPGTEAEQYDSAWWPAGVVVTPKRNKDRRNSISGPGLVALDKKIDEETARRKAESELALKRNGIVDTVQQKLGLTPKDKFQLKKLWEGGTAVFVTKLRTDINCSYDGIDFIQASGQKMQVG